MLKDVYRFVRRRIFEIRIQFLFLSLVALAYLSLRLSVTSGTIKNFPSITFHRITRPLREAVHTTVTTSYNESENVTTYSSWIPLDTSTKFGGSVKVSNATDHPKQSGVKKSQQTTRHAEDGKERPRESVVKRSQQATAEQSRQSVNKTTNQRLSTTIQHLKYVTFGGKFADGRRLGNQMFNFAAVVYIARLTGRRVAMERANFIQGLDMAFQLDSVERLDDLCPCFHWDESKPLSYDSRLQKLEVELHESDDAKTIFLNGFFQSWKYTRDVETELRNFFRFKANIVKFALNFIASRRPDGWSLNAYTRVAVHIRRGDVLDKDKLEFGYTVPSEDYFWRAMHYFVSRYHRVQFLAMSEDTNWARKNIVYNNDTVMDRKSSAKNKWETKSKNLENNVNVTYVFGHTAEQDMAVMAACDHVIMSTGTFGWWGAWLAKGTTIYYRDWPRNGSILYEQFKREDFFPPTWIGMS